MRSKINVTVRLGPKAMRGGKNGTRRVIPLL
jgi:hypothetical protein